MELHWLRHQSSYPHRTFTVFILTHETTWLLLPRHSSFDLSPLALLPTCWRSLFIASTPGDYGKGSELPHGHSDGSPLRRRRYPSSCLFFLRPLLLGYSAYMLAELLYCVHARRLWKGEQVASQLLRRSSLRRRRYPLLFFINTRSPEATVEVDCSFSLSPPPLLEPFHQILHSSCFSFAGTSQNPL